MFHPLKTLMWFSLLHAVIGAIPIIRFVFFYLTGNGNGHLQSLVLGAALLVLAAIVLIAGLLADLISQNRRLIEKHALHQSVSEVGKLVSKGSKDH